MLKKKFGLFLGLVVLAGSACVTPTHASSAPSVIMVSIQAGASGDAKQELIILYNQSPEPVDITHWCLKNKAAVAFACFTYPDTEVETTIATLPPYGYATVASKDFAYGEAMDESYYSLAYAVTNQSSGSIIGGSDTIQLVDASDSIIDSLSWSSTLTPGKVWARTQLIVANAPDVFDVYANTAELTDWEVRPAGGQPFNSVILTQLAAPVPEKLPPLLAPYITELLANPKGPDGDGEFIELYNPNTDATMMLTDTALQVGFETAKTYTFPEGASIAPLSYATFYSSDMGFSLTNTKGRVWLVQGELPAGEVVEYVNAKDDESWALIDGAWQYTSLPTPGSDNVPSPIKISIVKAAVASAPKPCAANQYRNPDTGRCRLIVSSQTTQTPCKAGQERNPETNRCRNITKMTNAAFKVSQVESDTTNQVRWYYWVGIGAIAFGIISYAVWEWRIELRSFGKKVWSFVMHRTNLY